MNPSDKDVKIGLCDQCRHAQVLHNSRGSTFYLCELSFSDPRFVKYPRLPMITCGGYKSMDEPSNYYGE